MSSRITIGEVAHEAGVSMMTVSRVINHKGEVSAATIQRVQGVIERLGYRPSSIARGLATHRTGAIGLVVPDLANPFFSTLAQGVVRAAYAEGYNVFLCTSDEDSQRESAIIQSLEDKRVDGLILCSSRLDEAELEDALANCPAAVVVNRRVKPGLARTVVVDDALGGALAAQHLIAGGHRAIGFLTGPLASYSGRERSRGFRAALAEAQISFHSDWAQSGLPTLEGGKHAAQQLLYKHPELTALYCYNDLVAVGALYACRALERHVPQDIAIVGSDDIPLASLVMPQLTTCRVPLLEMGTRAMHLLLKRIHGRTDDNSIVILEPTLVVRASAPNPVLG
jgi:LacI family transcriptional regulator